MNILNQKFNDLQTERDYKELTLMQMIQLKYISVVTKKMKDDKTIPICVEVSAKLRQSEFVLDHPDHKILTELIKDYEFTIKKWSGKERKYVDVPAVAFKASIFDGNNIPVASGHASEEITEFAIEKAETRAIGRALQDFNPSKYHCAIPVTTQELWYIHSQIENMKKTRTTDNAKPPWGKEPTAIQQNKFHKPASQSHKQSDGNDSTPQFKTQGEMYSYFATNWKEWMNEYFPKPFVIVHDRKNDKPLNQSGRIIWSHLAMNYFDVMYDGDSLCTRAMLHKRESFFKPEEPVNGWSEVNIKSKIILAQVPNQCPTKKEKEPDDKEWEEAENQAKKKHKQLAGAAK